LKHKCIIRHILIPFSNLYQLLRSPMTGMSLYIVLKIKQMIIT